MEREERNEKEMFGKKETIMPDSDIEFLPIPRPCTVRGKKAFFHKWADKKDVVLQHSIPFVNVELSEYGKEELRKSVREGYISTEYDIYTRAETVGIIEYEDGTVDEVSPRDIKFTEPCHYGDLIVHIKN